MYVSTCYCWLVWLLMHALLCTLCHLLVGLIILPHAFLTCFYVSTCYCLLVWLLTQYSLVTCLAPSGETIASCLSDMYIHPCALVCAIAGWFDCWCMPLLYILATCLSLADLSIASCLSYLYVAIISWFNCSHILFLYTLVTCPLLAGLTIASCLSCLHVY